MLVFLCVSDRLDDQRGLVKDTLTKYYLILGEYVVQTQDFYSERERRKLLWVLFLVLLLNSWLINTLHIHDKFKSMC